ncbi:MAG: succinylglutamate desuccinylase/aspartoacylase family protein [Kiloniellales bacterium]
MARRSERLPLAGATPGTTREVLLHRYGAAGARPKAYLQAALHADETPALLAAHHLTRLLDEAEAKGEIRGEIVLAPYANPIGLAQFAAGRHIGRNRLHTGVNFNREWPDLFEPAAGKVGGRLTASAEENVALIRTALLEAVESLEAQDEGASLQKILAREAADADIVLDLHCDDESLMHLFLIPAHWPLAADLAAELGCRAVLLSEDSGGSSFDEAFSTPWTRLAARFPDHPIPAACLAGTVELRGKADVDDRLAEADARALFRFLQRHSVLAGDPGPAPEPQCEATRLDACEFVRAPAVGVVSYEVEPGDRVRRGDVIAWLIDPAADDPTAARQAIEAGTDGLVLSRRGRRYVAPGMTLCKIVGTETLPKRAGRNLLTD